MPTPLAQREVLGVHDRRPPARVPLVRAVGDAVVLDERRVALVPVRPFPAAGLEVHRAERLGARVVRRAADVALRRPLLARVHDAVRLVVVLGAAGADVVVVARVRGRSA